MVKNRAGQARSTHCASHNEMLEQECAYLFECNLIVVGIFMPSAQISQVKSASAIALLACELVLQRQNT